MSSPFRFGALVAEAEDVLVQELGLEPCPLAPELSGAEGTWRGRPAVIETRAYRGGCLRYVRFVRMVGDGLDIGNVLCLSDPVAPLPILGADLVAVGRDTGMVAADISPTLPAGPEREGQLELMAAAHARRPELPSGGELPAWCSDWFSPYALYTRVPVEQATEAARAFLDTARTFVQIARATAPRVESLTTVAAAQEGYAEAHRTDDKGLRMLANVFGAVWAERYVRSVLFPPLDPRLFGWEIAVTCDIAGRVTWADDRGIVLLGARPGRRFADLVLAGQREKASRFLLEAQAGSADGWELTVMMCGRLTTMLFRGMARAGGVLVVGSLLPELHREAGARVVGVASELATLYREAERRRRELADTQAGLREALAREQAARASAEVLAAERAAVLGQISEGVIIADADGRIAMVNEAAARLHGVAEVGVAVSRYTEMYHLLTPEGRPYPPEELPLARAVLRGETVVDAEWRVHRPDGSEVIVQGSAVPVVADDGQRLGAVLAVRDISAQRMLDRQKDDFLASVSHDLKNPLTSLRGFAQLLRRQAQRGAPLSPDRVVALTQQMEASTTRMASMLDELLDLARLRMGQPLDLHLRPTDLVALARDVTTEQQASTEIHRVRVETELEQLVGEWDPSRLGRVLVNLVENAIKYSPSGGDVIVSVGRRDRDTGSWATFDVADQGIGIPEADLERVFERFQRGSNVVGRVVGTGIGLAGVRDIVELHGGAVTLASQEGVGTTVSVRLPLVARDGSRARA